MPWTGVDHDAMKKAAAISPIIGETEQHVIGGLALLWAWCWAERRDRVTALQLEGFMGTASTRLIEALVGFEFIDPDGDLFRVRGAEKRLKITKARQASAAATNAKRASVKRRSTVARPHDDRTQNDGLTLTPTQLPTPAPEEDSSPSGPVAVKPPRDSQLVLEYWAEVRGKPKAFDSGDYAVIERMLKVFSREQLEQAADGIARDDWPDRPKQDGVSIVYGTADQVRKFIALAGKAKRQPLITYKPGTEPWLQAAK